MGAAASLAVRFGIGSPTGARAPIWRVWATPGKDDLYLSGRSFAGDLKVSLHGSGVWRLAFTEQHAQRVNSLVAPGKDRLIHRWSRPPEFAPGCTKAFVIATPWLSLIDYPTAVQTKKQIVWLSAPDDGWETQVFVILVRHGTLVNGWPGSRSMGTSLVGRIVLPSETAWLVAHRIQVNDEDAGKLDGYTKSVKVTHKSDGTPMENLRMLMIGHDPEDAWWFRDVPLI